MDCLFCNIIEGSVPSKRCFENDYVYAFHDIAPAAPVHILIIPKKHIATMNDVTHDDGIYIQEIHRAAQQIAKDFDIFDRGYRLINNCGSDGGQVVYHLHYHLLGGEKLGSIGI